MKLVAEKKKRGKALGVGSGAGMEGGNVWLGRARGFVEKKKLCGGVGKKRVKSEKP